MAADDSQQDKGEGTIVANESTDSVDSGSGSGSKIEYNTASTQITQPKLSDKHTHTLLHVPKLTSDLKVAPDRQVALRVWQRKDEGIQKTEETTTRISIIGYFDNLSVQDNMATTKNEAKEKLDAQVKSVDMSDEMQLEAIEVAQEAMSKYSIEKDIAMHIKKTFDERKGPTWHCIVGRNFGSFVTHETKHFIYFYLGHCAILLFKTQ